ncbi:hypothetical protein BD310DRAFT_1040619 [Dichomitus squalens]|uniref:Uncharacterized protein n=1 Tax=Dichomitus squalens TaxID=114155 RepID=A0A4V6MWQ8_9APHY|nr:hypothetical protein BD310DRAFT_1040619 [Dichomitus squalens]
MVSTGWRTASAVIIIVVGSALFTFAVFVYRRRRYLRQDPNRPEMRQRFMRSHADDPEAHVSLLRASDMTPPVPPKPPTMSHGRSLSGQTPTFPTHGRSLSNGPTNEWGEPDRQRTRSTPTRVPVPPMFPEHQVVVERPSYDGEGGAPISMPEPSLSHTPSIFERIQLPRIQFTTSGGGRKGRFPSLQIAFVRESNQVISSPADGYHPPPNNEGPPLSASSGSSSLSRPFATMSTSPLPHIKPVSPISMTLSTVSVSRQSPSTVGPQSDTSTVDTPSPREPSLPASTSSDITSPSDSRLGSPASINTAGLDDFSRNLFSRKLSTEGGHTSSGFTLSRGSSCQTGRPTSDPGRPARQSSLSSGSASASGSSSKAANLRRASTWVPNVLASYSPWHNVVPDALTDSSSRPGERERGDSQVESPTGQIRVADAYRPMPTLEENPSEVSPVTLALSLPESPPLQAVRDSLQPGWQEQDEGRPAAEPPESAERVSSSRVSWGSVHELLAQVQRESTEMLPSPHDASPPQSPSVPHVS